MTRRIHVVGSGPRTGTTLLTELLACCFELDGACEHELSIFRKPEDEFETFLSKDPGDVLVAASLLEIDPALWILHMVRDPRDVVVSRHGRDPEHYWTNLRIWKFGRRAARRAEGHPRFLTLRYEDLVRQPDAVQDEIARFLPFLERRNAFSEFHRLARPSSDALDALGELRPLSSESIGTWRAHKPRLAAQLARHGPIDRDLVELGYELDASWRDALVGVEPDHEESHFPERQPIRRRVRRALRRRRKVRAYRRALRRRGRAGS